MRRARQFARITIAGWVLLMAGCSARQSAPQPGSQLPSPDPPFQGVISSDPAKAKPAWPSETAAKKDAPNVVLILVDDVGFSATSTFGGVRQRPDRRKLFRQIVLRELPRQYG